MSMSLHAAVIPSFQQMLGTASGLLDKAEQHCAGSGVAPAEITQARLYPDMLPFAYQIKSVAYHSAGAVEGVRKGEFSPDESPFPTDFQGLRDRLAGAVATLEAVGVEEMEGFIGRDMLFAINGKRIPYNAEDFLLSFSQPNVYFHTTTAYGIMRMKGVEIGKVNFLGRVRRRR